MQRDIKPPIIIGPKLVAIFDDGIKELLEIKNNLLEYEKLNGLYAAYLYGYSILEGTLFKIYSKVLKAFPEKANLEYNKINKNLLFENSRTSVIIDNLCDNLCYKLGHDNFKRYILDFNDIVGIDLESVIFPVKELDLYKLNRNKLAHRGEKNLQLNKNLINKHIDVSIETLRAIKDKFIPKYSKFTDIELIKNSCEYVFSMSEYEFNKCFIFHNGHVAIIIPEIERFYDRLSSSEKHCFLLFIANYNPGISKEFKVSDLRARVSLDNETLDKIAYINDLFEEYPHLINR